MRTTLFALLMVPMIAVGCGKDSTGGGGGGGGGPDSGSGSGSGSGGGSAAFTITSTDVTLQPGQEVTYCYYFHTPNTTPVAVNHWVSDMTPGSHHMIFFAGGSHADGLDMNNSCGFGGGLGGAQSIWTYASQEPHGEELLPADDGTGKPLAQLIAPNTAGAFQMHYLNATNDPITAHVQLKAYALPDGATYTPTAAFITYNNDISIPPHATNFAVTASCAVPASKFWLMSTHAHKQEVATTVNDGTSTIFASGTAPNPTVANSDWEHPGAKVWDANPFYTFTSGKVTWTCTYNNTLDNANNTVTAGTSAQTNEMCMATGYMFPATASKGCLVQGGNCYCN